MQVNAVDSQSLESTLQDWMSECRSEEHIRLWQAASWTVYIIVTGTVAPVLWTGLIIGVPAALALAWTVIGWHRTVLQRHQIEFDVAFVQSMTNADVVADALDGRGSFWQKSLLAQALASSGLSSELDVRVRDSLETDLANVLRRSFPKVHAPQDRIGLLLNILAGAGLLLTFWTASDTGSLAVALSAAIWLTGLLVLDAHVRRRGSRRNYYLSLSIGEGARWMSELVRTAIDHTPGNRKAFRRTEYYRQHPWIRR